MPDQEQQHSPAGGTQTGGQKPEPSSARPEPKIRTMKSDISEFMKETKPSLIQILTKQVEYQPPETKREKKLLPLLGILLGIVGFLVLMGGGWIGYQYFILRQTGSGPETKEETVPPSPISVEKVETRIIARDALALQQSIFTAGGTTERLETIKRLVIKIKEKGDNTTRLLKTKDLFEILDIPAPSQVFDSLQETLFLYTYQTRTGPRLILAAVSKSPGRTFAGILGWENSMQRDLEIMFLGEPPAPVIAPFLDKTFRNIDYRFLAIKNELGLGHFIFSAKNLLVISSSEEALQVVINRLFESR